MDLSSECDDVSSGSETSRSVKSVRVDEVATNSTSDLDSPSEDDGRSTIERDDLLQRMVFHKSQGRSRSRRKAWSQSLVEREVDFWRHFCGRIHQDYVECLQACEAQTMKTYLEWRVKNWRVKKESTIKSYWKRLSCAYIDYAGRRMDNGTELDIRDWIPTYLAPTYRLETSEKDKFAMFVRDFYVIMYAHWVEDPKPLPGVLRLEISVLYLLSAATATRPGALVESSSAKGTNKSLWYDHIEILKIRHPENPSREVWAVKVNLVHIKDSGGKGRRKKFIFYEESTLAYCLVYQIMALAFAHRAFRRTFTSVQQLLSLTVPAGRDVLQLKFKPERLPHPFFRDVRRTATGFHVSDSKALPYHKYRDHHVHLGRLSGFENTVELYQLRRGSGRNINSALTPEERNQTMGHHGDTYEQFYMPDLIERDFQSIYFGTSPQDELIRAVARMGLTRDKRAPTELTVQQKQEIRNDPRLVMLRAHRDRRRARLTRHGYHPLSTATDHPDFIRYKELGREINSMTTTLRNKRLAETIREFHDTIDGLEIDRQLDGATVAEPYMTPTLDFESPDRALVAKFISLPLSDTTTDKALGGEVAFIEALVNLCFQQEGRRYRADPYHDEVSPQGERPSFPLATTKAWQPSGGGYTANDGWARPNLSQTRGDRLTFTTSRADGEAPWTFQSAVCLICIGEKGWSETSRTKAFARKSTLKRHLDIHVGAGQFNRPFCCRVPGCKTLLKCLKHYMNHSATMHKVYH